MKIINKGAGWFTPHRRQLLQMFLASLAPIVIGLGLATKTDTDAWLVIAGALVQLLAALVNLVNLRGLVTIWTVLRGAIYAGAATGAPALTVLGYIDDETSAALLTGLSLGLSSLSSLIAIFVSKDQAAALAQLPDLRVQKVSASYLDELDEIVASTDAALAELQRDHEEEI